MAAQSPIKPADLGSISTGALACDALKELKNTRSKMQTFLAWLLANDSSGNLGPDFLLAFSQQFLFDAAKKNWFVGTDATTGYLALFQYIALAGLDPDGATDGDTIEFVADDPDIDPTIGHWAIRPARMIYLAPTSGGVTVPSVATGGKLSVAHGFSATPKKFEAYLECNATDAGYAVGDRVSAHDLILHNVSVPENLQAVTVSANASVVKVTFRDGAGGDAYRLNNDSTFAIADITESKWNVKLYAAL